MGKRERGLECDPCRVQVPWVEPGREEMQAEMMDCPSSPPGDPVMDDGREEEVESALVREVSCWNS